MPTGTVLHVSPHPDDELVGAPATLLRLRDRGLRVVNLLCSLGRPGQERRREAEARAAAAAAGFELRLLEPLASDAGAVRGRRLAGALAAALADERPLLVVAPSPHDGHPAHEAAARALLRAIERAGEPAPRVWLWGLWADLALPTLYVPFDDVLLARALAALGAYAGELERNDYRAVLDGRSRADARLGSERVFGFGTPGQPDATRAELLCEVGLEEGAWRLGRPRRLGEELLAPLSSVDVGWWLRQRSPRAELERRRPRAPG